MNLTLVYLFGLLFVINSITCYTLKQYAWLKRGNTTDRIQDISTRDAKIPTYVGAGYDLLKGNPKADKIDPGFRAAIFETTFNKNLKTDDEKYLIPDGTVAFSSFSCSYTATTNEYTGNKEYQKDLKVAVSVNGGYTGVFEASFSASTDYNSVETSTTKDKSIFNEAGATCQVYTLERQNIFTAAPLNDDFKGAIEQALADKATWRDIFDYFGTHYVSQTVLGGRSLLRYKFTQKDYSLLKSQDVDVKVAAKFSYAKFSADTNNQWKQYEKQVNAFESKVSETKEYYIGGKPPKSGDWKDWQEEVQKQLAPIEYKVRLLTELVNVRNFPQLTSADIAKLKADFNSELDVYCKSINCRAPGNDPAFPKPASVKTHVTEGFQGGNAPFRPFSETKIPTGPLMTIKKVIIRLYNHGPISNIQFFLSDGVTSYFTAAVGANDGSAVEWNVPEGEYISQVELSTEGAVGDITFITNKGQKSPKFGSPAPNYRLIDLPGQLVGFNARFGAYFDGINFVSNEVVF